MLLGSGTEVQPFFLHYGVISPHMQKKQSDVKTLHERQAKESIRYLETWIKMET